MTEIKRRWWQKAKSTPLFVAVGSILILFLGYWVVLTYTIPGWPERGLFGDSFGALNTLFSGAALIGVIFALFIQQRQLSEMRRSFMLQQQPVVIVKPVGFRIDRPRLFTSPGKKGCAALSRYRCDFTITNVTDTPAVATVLTARLSASCDKSLSETLPACGEHIPWVAGTEPQTADLMFVPDEPYDILFRALRNRDSFALPSVSMRFVYRNMVGACFDVQQSFHVVPKKEVADELKTWHSAMTSFVVQHQEELTALANDRGEPGLFDKLQEALAHQTGDKTEVSLDCVPVPGTFQTSTISASAYVRFVNSAGIPRLTFADTVCPIKDDSEDES